jgi:transcriptional regulator with XRE-family HTH domain
MSISSEKNAPPVAVDKGEVMAKTLVERYVQDPIHMRIFQQERAIYEVTEQLETLMRELGINRSELAKRLGKTKGWVTQLLDGQANKTIRTIADAFAVLGHEYRAYCQLIQIGNGTECSCEAILGGDKALTIAQADALRVYQDLFAYRIHLTLEDDGWHIDYELKDPKMKGGGPHYIIDARNGAILSKKYEQ